MAIGYFASKTFSVSGDRVYTFDDFTRSGSLNIEEQESEGNKPSTYIKGTSLEDIGFTVTLIAQNGLSVSSEIDAWMDIKDAKVPYYLILNNKPVSKNKFLLTNVSVQDTALKNDGEIIKAKVQLQFKEFVRAGSKKETSTTAASKPQTSKASKSTKKRKNTNAKASKVKGAKVDIIKKSLYGGIVYDTSSRNF